MPDSFTYERGLARYSPKATAIVIEFDQLRGDRRYGDLHGEVSVQLSGRPVHRARLNLLSTQTKSALAKHLATRTRGLDVDWTTHVEEACSRTIEAVRAGQPAISLRDAERPPDAGWLLRPLIVGRLPTVIFGDGGSLKSYVALAALIDMCSDSSLLGMTTATQQRVAYLDWEFDAWEHKGRMRRLLPEPAELPDIVYVPCSGPLRDQVDRLQQILREKAITEVVIDSVGLACDGPPEEAEAALGFFQALRALDVGAVCIAHANRAGDTDRPFGSVYWHNSARMTWYVKRVQEAGGDTVDIGLFNRKSNTSALSRPLGFRFAFDELRTTIERTDVRDVPQLAGQVSLKERISHALRLGAKTYAELAEQLDADAETIGRVARRYEGKLFTVVASVDGKKRVGLVRNEAADTVRPDTPDTVRVGKAKGGRTEGGLIKTPVRPTVRSGEEEPAHWWDR